MISPILGVSDNPVLWIVLAIIAIFLLVIMAVIGRFIKLWIQAYFAQADVSMFDLIGMRNTPGSTA